MEYLTDPAATDKQKIMYGWMDGWIDSHEIKLNLLIFMN